MCLTRQQKRDREVMTFQGLKTCSDCGGVLTFAHFSVSATSWDGFSGICRRCRSARWAAYNTTVTQPCAITGCSNTARSSAAGALCPAHHTRVVAHGDIGPVEMLMGTDDSVGYAGAHQRVRRLIGPASDHLCVCGCGEQAAEYAYQGGCPRERWELVTKNDGREKPTLLAYSPDPARYAPMAASCHRRFDAKSTTTTTTEGK